MNIAVTATGGGVGQSILKALKGSDYNIIALDSDRLGAGLYMVDRRYLIPYATSDEYIPFLLDFCENHSVDMLFPGMDCELMKLSKSKDYFFKKGTYLPISSPDIIEIADNKTLTQEALSLMGLPTIGTYTLEDFLKVEHYPVICKPRIGGARSKDVKIIRSDDEVFPEGDFVIQDYIEGDEYTCGTVTLDGEYKGCIVMRRILRDGDTYKAFVERNEAIEALCKIVCEELKPEGAFNIQLRMKDGIPYVFEFNARCSGTTGARALAGFNEPLMIADYYLRGIEPKFTIRELTILRYWQELVVKELL